MAFFALLSNASCLTAQIVELSPSSIASPVVAQELVVPALQTLAPQRHLSDLGNGPIDINTLPSDVLQCDVCRKRLGLAPLALSEKAQIASRATKTAKSESKPLSASTVEKVASQSKDPSPAVRMLGSPGIISSVTAEQLAKGELIVEEFKPPQTPSEAIQLDGIPYEVRQQFIQGLQLPYGAKVMSAKVQDANKTNSEADVAATNNSDVAESIVPRPKRSNSQSVDSGETRSLGGPGIVSKTESALPPPAEENSAKGSVQQEPKTPETSATSETQIVQGNELATPIAPAKTDEPKIVEPVRSDELVAQRQAFEESVNRMKAEWDAQMARADAVNKEVLTMLEKRTAEVTELQVQLKAQQELIAKTKADLEAKSKEAESKKKEPKKSPAKAKQSAKPSIST